MSELKPGLEDRYQRVKQQLRDAEKKCQYPENSIVLLPVSKTFNIQAIEQALNCGMSAFGENYVQEACEKIDFFKQHYPDKKIEWHLIGPLQSNKTRPVAERFDWVQTVDRLKIAERLSQQRPENLPDLNVLIEVHVSDESTKSGVKPDEVRKLAREIQNLPRLKLRGLMAIPAPAQTEAEQLKPLKAMRQLFDEMNQEGFNFDTLSMGMSGDLESAVKAGTTMVRIGSAIFGFRDYLKKDTKHE